MIWDEEDRFNTLRSIHVWDSSEGNASCTANKTSVYLFNEENECLARMVNISTSVIDEIDDFSLSIDVLLRMIKKYMDLWRYLSQRHYWANSIILCSECHDEIHGKNRVALGGGCIDEKLIDKLKGKYCC